MCRKRKHKTKEVAIIVWKKFGKRVNVNTYYCDKCQAWHLGTSRSDFRFQKRIDQILTKVK